MNDNKHSHHTSGPYHFNFLRDAVVPGFYISEFENCFSKYPFLINAHQFDFYSLALFTKGKGTVKISNETYEINPNRLFFIPANTEHSFHFSERSQGFYTFFCQDFYSDEFSMLRLLYLFSFFLPIANRKPVNYIDITEKENSIKSLFDILFDECNHAAIQKNNISHIVRSYLNILILKLSEFLNTKYSLVSGETNTIIIKLSHLIEANFIQQQHGEFYAKSLGISETKLNSICKKTLDSGLKKLILERRIMEVRKMLEQTDLSIAEIAYKFNYSDNSYFNKVFKSHTRLTPGRYRELHKRMLKKF
ncbi:MAG TPA: AraC family transcriptional regulator [Bacteroidales bacterium]|nr:AraC family transcriptional regulator [Bacteroidales bacterium]HPS16082.1 AraC family transcriptional regulator [Bacteroidales bacterium]